MLKLVTGECVIAIKAGDGGYGEPIVVTTQIVEGEEQPRTLLSMNFIPYGLVESLPEIEIPESAVILAVPVNDVAANAYFDAKARINEMIKSHAASAEAAAQSVEDSAEQDDQETM